jgi:hypothetical protein
MYMSIFFGIANPLNSLGEGLIARYDQWPVLSTEPFDLTAHTTPPTPGEYHGAFFNYTIPVGIQPTTYLGNVWLWKCNPYGQGILYDRRVFYNTVS